MARDFKNQNKPDNLQNLAFKTRQRSEYTKNVRRTKLQEQCALSVEGADTAALAARGRGICSIKNGNTRMKTA